MSVRIVVRLYEGDDVIHEFTRATTNVETGIGKLLGEAMGWLQAYSGAVNARQWASDVRRVRAAKALLDATDP